MYSPVSQWARAVQSGPNETIRTGTWRASFWFTRWLIACCGDSMTFARHEQMVHGRLRGSSRHDTHCLWATCNHELVAPMFSSGASQLPSLIVQRTSGKLRTRREDPCSPHRIITRASPVSASTLHEKHSSGKGTGAASWR